MIWWSGTFGVVALWRWWRVAQREHYLPGMVSRFAGRWWRLGENVAVMAAVVVVGCFASVRDLGWLVGLVSAAAAAGPVGLGWKGRTSPLTITPRLRRVAGLSAMSMMVMAWLAGRWGWLAVLAAPVVVDGALTLLRPVENALGHRWIVQATEGLGRAGVRTVAITGSFGKTSTKVALAHLLSGVTPVVASPASFNNALGLARAVNEHLTPGTEVFVAEMGTYGSGEIARMCGWVRPEVAVITAIGPVHLERMKTIEQIAAAKREILEGVRVGVLMVDDPHLAGIAEEEQGRIEVIRVSLVDREAEVALDPVSGEVFSKGMPIGSVELGAAHPANVVCALGVVLALGYEPSSVLGRVATIPVTPHRGEVVVGESGLVVIDDTFNANPSGARAAIERLVDLAGEGRRVLVTPGMVEMGATQYEENRRMIDPRLTDLVIVGRTNLEALRRGAIDVGLGSVIVVENREAAVEWVKTNLTAGDAVLYENDLPDHHP